MTDTTASVVAEVNFALGTDYRLVRQLAGGLQSSAYELSDGGPRVVLKWSDDPGALRAGGRATAAVCAAAAYASVAEFVRQRSRYSQDLVLHGGRRLLELLDA